MQEQNNTQNIELDLNEILRIRREKLKALQDAGKNPYEIVKYDRNAYSLDIKENYAEYEGKTVNVAGRLVSKRIMGKASFAVILDGKGTIQAYLSINDLGDSYLESQRIPYRSQSKRRYLRLLYLPCYTMRVLQQPKLQ